MIRSGGYQRPAIAENMCLLSWFVIVIVVIGVVMFVIVTVVVAVVVVIVVVVAVVVVFGLPKQVMKLTII